MRIHHFYPRTQTIGDHFVALGIASMIRSLVPDATFEHFDVNSRGADQKDYGLTEAAVERANNEADLVIVGGSNLYEGSFGWPWGVHLDLDALPKLRVPLFLLGLGTGSSFASPLHQASPRARAEIIPLNKHATLSGVRDVTTLDWLLRLGVTKAKLMGDPAAFIFNRTVQTNTSGQILIAMPPRRIWTSKRQFWKVRREGRRIALAMVRLTRSLLENGADVAVVCNDPLDLPVWEKLFDGSLPRQLICPQTPAEYFQLLRDSRAVISGRLHTAVAALSLGIPFLLIDLDARTHGFLQTYQLEDCSISPSLAASALVLTTRCTELLNEGAPVWQSRLEKRDQLYDSAMGYLRTALERVS